MDSVLYLPKLYDRIYDFCVDFYLSLVREKTVQEAFDIADKVFSLKVKQDHDEIDFQDYLKYIQEKS